MNKSLSPYIIALTKLDPWETNERCETCRVCGHVKGATGHSCAWAQAVEEVETHDEPWDVTQTRLLNESQIELREMKVRWDSLRASANAENTHG